MWLASYGFLGITEAVTRFDALCTLLVGLGVALVAASRSRTRDNHTAEELSAIIGSTLFIASWLSVMVFGAAVPFVKRRLSPTASFITTAFFGATCAAVSQSLHK